MISKRTIPALIAAAQADGWHNDPLGREIIAEITLRQQIATRPKQVIWGISGALLVAAGLILVLFIQTAQLESVIKATGSSEEKAAKIVADAEAVAAKTMSDARDAAAKTISDAEAISRKLTASGEALLASERLRAEKAERSAEYYRDLLNSAQAEILRLREQSILLKSLAKP